jgi:hypothetical protein
MYKDLEGMHMEEVPLENDNGSQNMKRPLLGAF